MRLRTAVLAITAALSFAGTAVAAPAPVVGTATLELEDGTRSRKVVSELWFEAAPGSTPKDFTVRLPLRAISIARGAEPAPGLGKRPLVVISHGNWGTRYSLGWLAQRLVGAGYVVLSTSHAGTLADDQSALGRWRLWDRSLDISFAISKLLTHAKWAPLVDATKIGFVGHSFGGWTAVSLAGGRYDPQRQREFCRAAEPKDAYCAATLSDNVADMSTAGAGESFKDDRIKAYYIMASGPGQGFTEASVQAISAPFVVDTAEQDSILEPTANSGSLARRIPGAQELRRNVGHFTYVPECKALVGVLLARAAGAPICDDPRGVDRAALHRDAAAAVVRHFNVHLRAR